MKTLCAILLLFGVLLSLAGCNTIKGVGRDVQQVGETLDDAAHGR